MKRKTAMALAAVFAMSVAGTALAAPTNPFSDVPAKHWAYDSVSKLAQAGVISGYGDGTYKGDRTMTRYEMAAIIGKALANSDKADAGLKKELDALQAEFSAELYNLGVRVDNLESKMSNIKFTGEIRERYEYFGDGAKLDRVPADRNDKNYHQLRARIFMTAPVADNVTFKGRFEAKNGWGDASDSKLDQAYIMGKLGGVDYSFGRQALYLGQGLLADTTVANDGLILSAGKDVRVTVGATKKGNLNYYHANVGLKLSNDLSMTASYLGNNEDGVSFTTKDGIDTYKGDLYDTFAVGLKYTGIKNFTVSGEYGQNDSEYANIPDKDAAKAWFAKVKYLGAQKNQPKSYGIWAGYRQADKNFDNKGLTSPDYSDAPGVLKMDDIKGLEVGVDYTLFRNGVLTIQYSDFENREGNRDKKITYAQLAYSF